jgi:biopolymer transport protein ExbD
MSIPARPRRAPRLDLSPLIDVIFILLIFVVLVARFVDQERLDVTLPSADAGRPAEFDALMIVVRAGGELSIEGVEVAPDELADVLARARRRFDRAVVVADEAARVQAAVDAVSAAKLAGFGAVSLATRPPAP